MKKRIFLCAAAAVLLLTVFPSAAERITQEYTYGGTDTVVSVRDTVIKDLNEIPETVGVDFLFRGENVEFFLDYSMIYHDLTRFIDYNEAGDVIGYRDFTAAVEIGDAREVSRLPDALRTEGGYFLDFADGETYPGLMRMTVRLGEGAAGPMLLYTVENSGEEISLVPAANGFYPGEDGTLTLCVTESHDYLVLPKTQDGTAEAAASPYIRQALIEYDDGGETVRAVLKILLIVLLVLVGIGVCVLIGYLAYRFTRPRRKAEKSGKKSLPAPGKNTRKD